MGYIVIARGGKEGAIWERERERRDTKGPGKYGSHVGPLKHELVTKYSFRRRPMFSATTTCDPSIDRDHNLWYFSASLQLSQLVIPPSTGATTCDILHIPTRITTCDILLCKDHNLWYSPHSYKDHNLWYSPYLCKDHNLWSLHNKITTCGCSPVESHLPIGPGSAHRNFILSETFTEREYCIAHHYETRYFTLCSNNENTNRVCYPSNMHLLKRYRTETFYIG
jgi:hypothetical protein